jgi:hypothetical protein
MVQHLGSPNSHSKPVIPTDTNDQIVSNFFSVSASSHDGLGVPHLPVVSACSRYGGEVKSIDRIQGSEMM